MRILYVFPHPDDESFGPALAISRQRRQGEEIHLLTLTRGGATRQRHALGLSIDEMGETRYREMQCMAGVLGLAGMEVLDLPDGELAKLDPIEIEQIVQQHVERVDPEVIVTYAVHGISGFTDHLVTHAVVKRVFCAMRRDGRSTASRLAFFTLLPSDVPDGLFTLKTSKPEEIGCAIRVDAADHATAQRALDCYVTYRATIDAAKPLERVGDTVYFELFGETHQPPLDDL